MTLGFKNEPTPFVNLDVKGRVSESFPSIHFAQCGPTAGSRNPPIVTSGCGLLHRGAHSWGLGWGEPKMEISFAHSICALLLHCPPSWHKPCLAYLVIIRTFSLAGTLYLSYINQDLYKILFCRNECIAFAVLIFDYQDIQLLIIDDKGILAHDSISTLFQSPTSTHPATTSLPCLGS